MGGYKLPYPDAPPARIHEIYQESCSKTIYTYGFLVDPFTPSRPLGSRDPFVGTISHPVKSPEELLSLLCAAGLTPMALVLYPIPKSDNEDDGWLIVLETGFRKKLHQPVPDAVLTRVQAILNTTESPSWWRTSGFRYPLPETWIKCKENKAQQA